jgi:arginine deiminase
MSDDLKDRARFVVQLFRECSAIQLPHKPTEEVLLGMINRIEELERLVNDAPSVHLAYAEELQDAEARIEELEAKLAKAVEASVEAVWAEYIDSIESKWTFRKEHVQNAIVRTLAELKGGTDSPLTLGAFHNGPRPGIEAHGHKAKDDWSDRAAYKPEV